MSPRALALRAIGLGDFLAGVPALRTLRRALPDHRLVLAAPAALDPLVRLCSAVDDLLPTAELAPILWSGPPPSVAVDLHGNGPATKDLLRVLRPDRLVAFAGPDGDGSIVAGPAWRPAEHERDRWCRLVSTAFGVPSDPADVVLAPPPGPPAVRGAVIVHVGAAAPSRRWPEDRFAAVARWLHGHGEDVVLTGSPAEAPAARRVAAAAGLSPSAVVAGETDLGGLAALVASARLVVSGDTGIAHLATAYRTASVVLFGPVSPTSWGPPRTGPHTVLWHGDGTGDPHGQRTDESLLRIDVDEVCAAIRRRLEPAQRSARPPTPPCGADPPARPRAAPSPAARGQR